MVERRRTRLTRQERKEGRPILHPLRGRPKIEEWHRRYAENARLKFVLRPAYNKAIGTPLAQIISYMKQPRVRILVLGGGTGVFSRDLLPQIQRILRKQGSHTKIEVVETDPLEIVLDAPPHSHRIRMDADRLSFKNQSFDLVVGQSMLHQTDLRRSIPEIKRVMKTSGFFFNVQDDPPAFKGSEYRRLLEGGGQVSPTKDMQQRVVESGMRATEAFAQSVVAAATHFRLSSVVLLTEGRALVSAKTDLGTFSGRDLNEGYGVEYSMGSTGRIKERGNIPNGKKELSYKGIITILANQSVTPLAQYMQSRK